jgi:hypothetical protein
VHLYLIPDERESPEACKMLGLAIAGAQLSNLMKTSINASDLPREAAA